MGLMDKIKLDGWENLLTAIGSSNDNISNTSFKSNGLISSSVLENMYQYDWLTQRIVDIFPEQALRQGININVVDKNIAQKYKLALDEKVTNLDLISQVKKALKWARLFGGSTIYLGLVDGGKPEEPLNINNIKSFEFMQIYDAKEITVFKKYSDKTKGNYGKPELLNIMAVNNVNTLIHESRCIMIAGKDKVNSMMNSTLSGEWGDSVIKSIEDQLKAYGIGMRAASVLTQQFISTKLGVENLGELLTTDEGTAALEKRAKLMASTMSNHGVMLLDKEEVFEKIQTPIAGFTDLLKIISETTSSACDIPQSELFGQAFGVLAGAQESKRTWYDTVRTYQINTIKPVVEKIVKYIFLSKDFISKGKEPEWLLNFPSLWQETKTEEASIISTTASSIVALVSAGIITEIEARKILNDKLNIELDENIDNNMQGNINE